MPWRLEKEFRFEASHRLHFHDGKCARLHGHSWVGRVILEGSSLMEQGPKRGMLMDFGDLKALLQPIVDELDHYHLNDVVDLESPTSERVAEWVGRRLLRTMPSLDPSQARDVRLWGVRIEETCTSAAEWHP